MLRDIQKSIDRALVERLSIHFCEHYPLDVDKVKKVIQDCIDPKSEPPPQTRVEKLKVECKTKKKIPVPKSQQELHVAQFRGQWLIQGSKFVVQGPSEKIIIGKLVNGKVTPLNTADLETCKQNKWVHI